MKEWMRRFGVVMVLGALVGGVVLAGCGGGDNGDNSTDTNNANVTNTTKPADEQ